MDKMKITSILIITSLIIVGTTCFAATGIVNAPSGLVLRKEASKAGEAIMEISDQTSVEIIGEDGEWYKVKYAGYDGYLFSEYVDVNDSQNLNNTEEIKEEAIEEKAEENVDEAVANNNKIEYPFNKKVTETLKMNSIPSVTSRVILNIEEGAEITINYDLNNWVNVTYNGKTGWIRKYFVLNESVDNNNEEIENEENTEEEKQEEEIKEIDNKTGYVDVSSSANIRKEASTSSEIIDTLLRNTKITIIAEQGNFYKIKYNDITGYISKDLVSNEPLPEVTSRSSVERKVTAEQTNEAQETNNNVESSNSSAGNDVVSFAKSYVGYSYVSGGTSPSTGFDCSGFTYYVFNSCGYSLSRSCQVQAKSGEAVSRENLQPGDLVFFNNGSDGGIGHAAIYIGGGQIVHAENSRTGVRIDTINSGYYNKYYYSARRVIN